MNIAYIVRQLDLELRGDEERLRDKKAARAKMFSLLSAQEKILVEESQPEPTPQKGK
jgi:hypothetical protein